MLHAKMQNRDVLLTDPISQPRKPNPERQESEDLGEIWARAGVAQPFPFSHEALGGVLLLWGSWLPSFLFRLSQGFWVESPTLQVQKGFLSQRRKRNEPGPNRNRASKRTVRNAG